MKPNQYPSLSQIISLIESSLKDQCTPSEFDIELKYAKLISPQTQQHIFNLSKSASNIVLLPSSKTQKINAKASQKQYQTISSNCLSLPLLQKPQTQYKLDIKFGREKLSKTISPLCPKSWIFQSKDQQIKKQQNLLINRKQFRFDISHIDTIMEDGETLIRKNKEKIVEKIKFMRFKEQIDYHISQYYYMRLSRIYESEEEGDKMAFYAVFKQEDQGKMEKYIIGNTPKEGKIGKYQIQLKFNQEGVEHMMKLIKKPGELNKFVGDAFHNARNLSDDHFGGMKEKKKQEEEQIEKLKKQMQKIKIDN